MRKNYRRSSSTRGNTGQSGPGIVDAHDDVMTVKAIADMLEITEAGVRKQIRNGQIPGHPQGDKYVVLRSEFMWVIRNRPCTMDLSDMYDDDEAA